MSGFVFHPAALTDLSEIWEYIAGGWDTLLNFSGVPYLSQRERWGL